MKILDICKIDTMEDSKIVGSFISQNYKSLIHQIKERIELMTERTIDNKEVYERADFINLKIAPYKNIFVVILLYKPDYLFSEARKSDITKFRKWLEGELQIPMKIIKEETVVKETTQSSSIPTPAANHVHLQPPLEMQKMKVPVPTVPGKTKQRPLITFEKKPENDKQ